MVDLIIFILIATLFIGTIIYVFSRWNKQVRWLLTPLIWFKNIIDPQWWAEKIFFKLFENPRIKKILLRIEKLDIIKNATSVGIELEKTRSNEH